MRESTISAIDLQALLDVTEGFATENGLDAVGRYAEPGQVQRAVINATIAMRKSDVKFQEKPGQWPAETI